MALEFLYAENDIPSFISTLYDNKYYLSRSAGLYKDQPLSYSDAASALRTDLQLPGTKVYWVGKGDQIHLLQLTSCGKQSHPCYAGKQGRIAGFLSSETQPETASESSNLLKIMKHYLKGNGSFRRYNGNARMSCYFLTNYNKLDEAYLHKPFPDHICRGVMRVLCDETHKTDIIPKLDKAPEKYPAIEKNKMIVNENWANHDISEILFDFLCDRNLFSAADLQNLILWLSDGQKSVMYNQKLQMIAESPPMSFKNFPEEAQIVIFIDNPWQCWINHEDEYTGRPIALWGKSYRPENGTNQK